MNRKLTTTTLAVILGTFVLAAGSCQTDKTEVRKADERAAVDQLAQYQQAQPVPLFSSSQLRQNLIEIETAQVNATVTTSFFFNLGVADPIHACASIGFPIPGSYQLTNPDQKAGDGVTVAQIEANGVYTGDTTGTTVICIDSQGRGYAHWWEGFVSTVAGPAEWSDGQIVLTGEPTAEFSVGE